MPTAPPRFARLKMLFSRETLPLLMSWNHPKTPKLAKFMLLGMLAYVISPLDVLPDVFPVLGWLDDIYILTMGLNQVRGMMPPEVLADVKAKARHSIAGYLLIGLALLLVLVGGIVALIVWWRRHA